ncbi:hypothetical protein FHU30_003420 [Actinomadura rupiterrae]|nr:hypothetical protein [Actinomadura rupiterrae]
MRGCVMVLRGVVADGSVAALRRVRVRGGLAGWWSGRVWGGARTLCGGCVGMLLSRWGRGGGRSLKGGLVQGEWGLGGRWLAGRRRDGVGAG